MDELYCGRCKTLTDITAMSIVVNKENTYDYMVCKQCHKKDDKRR
ncbi:MAG: hypothetical protein JW384_02462 [Nitrosomonadaceae bacterium]|jgi:hypothetical protein|nr:hypothetical protein [Nitrosomonadaceae bacterium]